MSSGSTNPFNNQGQLTETARLKALRARGRGGPASNYNSSHPGYDPRAPSIVSYEENRPTIHDA
jgi:hypothetical protein